MEKELVHGDKERLLFFRLCLKLVGNKNYSGTIYQIAKFIEGNDTANTAISLLKKIDRHGLMYKDGEKKWHGRIYPLYKFHYKRMLEVLDDMLHYKMSYLITYARSDALEVVDIMTKEERRRMFNELGLEETFTGKVKEKQKNSLYI